MQSKCASHYQTVADIFLALLAVFLAIQSSTYLASTSKNSATMANQRAVESSIISVIEQDIQARNDGTSLIGTFVRLSWHCAGTYSAADNSGGSNGGRIRFSPEKNWGANAGLTVAMDALEPVKAAHPAISYADLYTLAGKVAVEHAGGPKIPYSMGRVDDEDGLNSPPDGRLPDADKGSMKATHARRVQ